ncbi:MAG: helix-turn-helix transcriptional regulator [Leptothrix sp. (in: b-proteobacteria)]
MHAVEAAGNTGKPSIKTHQPIEAANIPGALLKAETVAAVTGLSVSTLYRLAAKGKLKRVRMGARCTRWRSDDVQAFLATQG